MGFLDRGQQVPARCRYFFTVWPMEKASSEQELSTLNKPKTIFISFGSHAGFESASGWAGFVHECGSDWLWADQLAGLLILTDFTYFSIVVLGNE